MSASSRFGQITKKKISAVITHHRPHEDEFVAIALLEMSEPFDLERATVITLRSDTDLALYQNRRDVLFVGIGAKLADVDPGKVFDEHHDVNGRRNRCAADIAAATTGIVQGTLLEGLLTEVREHDLFARSAVTSFASIIKALYESRQESEVIAWALQGARALCAHAFSPTQLGQNEELFLEISSTAWAEIGSRSGFHAREFGNMLPQMSASARSKSLTDISTIFSILMGENERSAKSWLRIAVEGMARKQTLFLHAVQEFLQVVNELQINVDPIDDRGRRWQARVAFVTSDSGLMDKVFRSKAGGDYDMLVLRNTNGHVCLFTNNRNQANSRFNLDALAAMIRWAEAKAHRRATSDWDSLAKDGDHAVAPEWFYFKKGGSILNGSKSKPDVPKTWLTWGDLTYIVKLAFTGSGVKQFIEENGIRN